MKTSIYSWISIRANEPYPGNAKARGGLQFIMTATDSPKWQVSHSRAKGSWPPSPTFWLPWWCWQWVCEETPLVLCLCSTDCNPDDMAEFSGTWLSASLSQRSHYAVLSFSVKSQQYLPHSWLFITSEEFIPPRLAPSLFIACVRTGSLQPSLPWADRCLLCCSSFR